MKGLSIIVPAHDNAGVILETLQSIERAVAHLRDRLPVYQGVPCDVVIVDDGSQDDTCRVVVEFTRNKDHYQLVQRTATSNAGCARNVGVAAARGDVLFFLDADDRFLERHLLACCRALEDPTIQFVKTGVALDAPVHADWYQRIINSLVINLAIRRRCHEFVGGFPDFHVYRRCGDLYLHEFDAFRTLEDVYYNRTVAHLFLGAMIPEETVHYIRSPGNAFDRQYEKFRVAPGQYREQQTDERKFQIKLSNLLFQHHLSRLESIQRQQAK